MSYFGSLHGYQDFIPSDTALIFHFATTLSFLIFYSVQNGMVMPKKKTFRHYVHVNTITHTKFFSYYLLLSPLVRDHNNNKKCFHLSTSTSSFEYLLICDDEKKTFFRIANCHYVHYVVIMKGFFTLYLLLSLRRLDHNKNMYIFHFSTTSTTS